MCVLLATVCSKPVKAQIVTNTSACNVHAVVTISRDEHCPGDPTHTLSIRYALAAGSTVDLETKDTTMTGIPYPYLQRFQVFCDEDCVKEPTTADLACGSVRGKGQCGNCSFEVVRLKSNDFRIF